MKYIITGVAGFIGSNLADRLLEQGDQVVGIDNFSTGHRDFLKNSLGNGGFTLVECDLLDQDKLASTMASSGAAMVYHMAANADVSRGTEHPRRDLEQNTIATSNVLEAMRGAGIGRIAFASTGSIYGEPELVPTPEDAPFPIQTSLYGASKLAAEGLIEAYCEGYGFQGWIFRFVSVLGERYTHGHVFDFYRKLRADPHRIRVLGDGNQTKSYMHIGDCLDGMQVGVARGDARVNIFNLGADETIRVRDSLATITARLGVTPEVDYAGGMRGWIGDSPLIHLDCARIRALGWQPSLTIREGIHRTLDWLEANSWVYGQ